MIIFFIVPQLPHEIHYFQKVDNGENPANNIPYHVTAQNNWLILSQQLLYSQYTVNKTDTNHPFNSVCGEVFFRNI